MRVFVEFYGIPRRRAGCESLEIHLADTDRAATLGDVLDALATELPEFARHCLDENRLKNSYIANLGGRQFLADPAAKIRDGENLLILSADAGG